MEEKFLGFPVDILPDRHVIPISGKDSLCTALIQTTRQPDLEYEFLFCDIGSELPQTYQWLSEILFSDLFCPFRWRDFFNLVRLHPCYLVSFKFTSDGFRIDPNHFTEDWVETESNRVMPDFNYVVKIKIADFHSRNHTSKTKPKKHLFAFLQEIRKWLN